MGVALLYRRLFKRVSVMDGIKFKLIDKLSLYTKNYTERRRFVNLGYHCILYLFCYYLLGTMVAGKLN